MNSLYVVILEIAVVVLLYTNNSILNMDCLWGIKFTDQFFFCSECSEIPYETFATWVASRMLEKGQDNDQELIQLHPTFHSQYQKGKKDTHKI